MLPLVDLFLYDVKHVDEQKHRNGTGVSNALILGNLEKLAAHCREGYPEITIRIPLVSGFNATLGEVERILDFLKQLRTLSDWSSCRFTITANPNTESFKGGTNWRHCRPAIRIF